ncbi:MAG: extracellular solute-binding protein [candidate division NC10 bacterium]|nr:extracellular solute-binding protein [candidate division NC10 bacterium]
MERIRGWLVAVSVVACTLGVVLGTARAQGKPEDSVVVYSAADADMVNTVVAAFEKKYPGIKVSTVVAGTGEIIKRIEAEKERPLGDVGWSFGPEAIGDKKGLFDPYLSKEAGGFFPGQVPADRVWTPFTTMPYVIMYNKKLVSEAEKPKAWKDVLDARWKGKVAYADATKSGSSYTLLVTWLSIYGKSETGWKFVEDLLRQCKVLPKSSMTYQGVANGEYPIGLTFEQAAFDYLKGGAPIGLIYPSEGTAITLDGSAIMKNAPHPNAARLFLDFTVSKEMQDLMVSRFGRRSVRKDVGSPAGLPALDQIKAIPYDLEYAATNRTQLLKRFQDALIKTQ